MKKREDGRYCKQVFLGYKDDGRRKFRTVYGQTIREVEKKSRELINQIDIGINLIDELTVREWSEIWLKTFKVDIANNTFVRYAGIVRNQINPVIGDMPLEKVRIHIVQRLINSLTGEYSPASVKKTKDVLHQMFQQAVRSQYIPMNPAENIAVPKHFQNDREIIPARHKMEIEEFCKKYKHGAFIMTLLYTGMRRGEILALTVRDIDFENGMIHVDKAVEFICNHPNVKVPKTPKSIRKIPILNPLIPYLKILTSGKSKDDLLFPGYDGELYTKSSVQRLFRAFNRDYNNYINRYREEDDYELVHFTMHQFRHTFCTMLYEADVDVKTAQEILGHNSVTVTLDIYTHLSQQRKKMNVDKINSFIEKQYSVSQMLVKC